MQQVGGGGVADGVWTHTVRLQRRQSSRHPGGIALDQAMNSKARYGSSAAIKKREVRWRTTIDNGNEHVDGFGPKRATTEFVPFTSDQDRGESGARCDRKLQICNLGLRRFVSTGASVVQEQQKGIVSLALCCRAIGSGEQGLHF